MVFMMVNVPRWIDLVMSHGPNAQGQVGRCVTSGAESQSPFIHATILLIVHLTFY